MPDNITITIPVIAPDAIANLEQSETVTLASVSEAFKTLRERFAPVAKFAGFVRIAAHNARVHEYEQFYQRNGKKIHALLALEDFYSTNTVVGGENLGIRLYLTESGDWLELKRKGFWSAYEGEPNEWSCGVWANPTTTQYGLTAPGYHHIVTDGYVAQAYNLKAVLDDLSKSLKKTQEVIPQRMTKLRQRAALAEQVVTALAEVK